METLQYLNEIWMPILVCEGYEVSNYGRVRSLNYLRTGKLCIFKSRLKTGVKFYSVLLPWAVDIVKKYNYQLPVISNQKTNSYIKEVQDICGIDVHLTFHKARHFYAMYLLNRKVPITTVQKAIGHANLAMTQHYAKALETTIIDDIASII